ncbi:MAG: hypothetical protein WD492_01815 [Alkalispirochaeta sp.]
MPTCCTHPERARGIAAGTGLYYRIAVDEITRRHLVIGRRLLWWSGFSVVAGIIGILTPWPVVQGIALQALIWGVVDAIVALVGLHGTRSRRDRYPDEERELSETARLRKTLTINGYLDLVYIAVGIAVIVIFRREMFPLGNGIGVVIQAIFLLVFDFGHARRLPSTRTPWYSPHP